MRTTPDVNSSPRFTSPRGTDPTHSLNYSRHQAAWSSVSSTTLSVMFLSRCFQDRPAVKLLITAFPSNSLNCCGSCPRNQSFPTKTPTNAPTVNILSTHFLVHPGSICLDVSSLNTKSCFLQKTLLHQNRNCQSGYIMLFSPVFGSTAQFVHPLAQTSFLASRCVHSKSCAAASGRTSTVAGVGSARMEGTRERDRQEGRDFRIGASRRRVKLIWHSTV